MQKLWKPYSASSPISLECCLPSLCLVSLTWSRVLMVLQDLDVDRSDGIGLGFGVSPGA